MADPGATPTGTFHVLLEMGGSEGPFTAEQLRELLVLAKLRSYDRVICDKTHRAMPLMEVIPNAGDISATRPAIGDRIRRNKSDRLHAVKRRTPLPVASYSGAPIPGKNDTATLHEQQRQEEARARKSESDRLRAAAGERHAGSSAKTRAVSDRQPAQSIAEAVADSAEDVRNDRIFATVMLVITAGLLCLILYRSGLWERLATVPSITRVVGSWIPDPAFIAAVPEGLGIIIERDVMQVQLAGEDPRTVRFASAAPSGTVIHICLVEKDPFLGQDITVSPHARGVTVVCAAGTFALVHGDLLQLRLP